MSLLCSIHVLFYLGHIFFLVWNVSDTVNSKAILLKLEYFKNIFRLKSEKIRKLSENFGILIKKVFISIVFDPFWNNWTILSSALSFYDHFTNWFNFTTFKVGSSYEERTETKIFRLHFNHMTSMNEIMLHKQETSKVSTC